MRLPERIERIDGHLGRDADRCMLKIDDFSAQELVRRANDYLLSKIAPLDCAT
jgi:hypothetical protein